MDFLVKFVNEGDKNEMNDDNLVDFIVRRYHGTFCTYGVPVLEDTSSKKLPVVWVVDMEDDDEMEGMEAYNLGDILEDIAFLLEDYDPRIESIRHAVRRVGRGFEFIVS